MILANCVLLMAANLELRSDKTPDFIVKYADMFNGEVETPASRTSCKSAGLFVINCTSYLVCAAVKEGFLGAEGTCPSQENFDPQTYECSSSYICPTCTTAGFVCANSTSFTLCAAAEAEIVKNQPCPSGYYCNNNCKFPCLSSVDSC